MTPAARLIADADRLGVRYLPTGEKLRVIVPEDVSDYDWTELRLGLVEFKAEVRAMLAVETMMHYRSCQFTAQGGGDRA